MIPAGGSWTANLSFFISTSAPIGCTAIAYNLEFPTGDTPGYQPFHFQRIFVAPSPPPRSRRDLNREKAACSKNAAKVNWNWRWAVSRPRWLPDEYMPTRDIPLLKDPNTRSPSSLPRLEFGFALGDTLAQIDANAAKRGLERDPNLNDSVRPDQWRYLAVLRDPEISVITMFLMDGPVGEIGIHYGTKGIPAKFEVIRDRLRKKLGKESDFEDVEIDIPSVQSHSAEHRRYQSAYWSDCRTLIGLRSHDSNRAELRFSDLNHGRTISMGIVGCGGRRHSFSGCE